MRVSQSESNKNILVMLDVDGVLLDRCNKNLLETRMQEFTGQLLQFAQANTGHNYNRQSFIAAFKYYFSAYKYELFALNSSSTQGEQYIATSFLDALASRLVDYLLRADMRNTQQNTISVNDFVCNFLDSDLVQDIIVDHDTSGWSFVTTPLIKGQLQDALEKYSVCFVTNGQDNIWANINKLFGGIIPPDYYYVVDQDEHLKHVQYCQEYYRINCAGRDENWKPPRILLAKDKLDLCSTYSVDTLLVVDDQSANIEDSMTLSKQFKQIGGVESMALLDSRAKPDLPYFPLHLMPRTGQLGLPRAGMFCYSLSCKDPLANAFVTQKPPSPTGVDTSLFSSHCYQLPDLRRVNLS